MSLFQDRKGQWHDRKPHFATFKGKHNATKTKILLLLYHRLFKLKNSSGLGVDALQRHSGCNYDYLRSKLGKWADWKYIKRKIGSNSQGRPVFVYVIADRGIEFIEKRVPQERIIDYIRELQAFKVNNTKGY